MKVFHIESGLGNQMLDYADMVASRKVNPGMQYYIETIVYDIPQNRINMWGGYQLDRVFGIHEKNIREYFNDEQWKKIIESVYQSEFWNTHWSYSDAIVRAFREQGLVLNDINPKMPIDESGDIYVAVNKISRSKYLLKQAAFRLMPKKYTYQFGQEEKLFRVSQTDDYDGHYLKFIYKGNGIERIDKELRKAFTFPTYDQKNEKFSQYLRSCNSVAIHARRGDMLGQNAFCYEYGYFKRAVSYIKMHVKNPVFVFFCDPGSIQWCKENGKIFGLDFEKDEVLFVDWNKDSNSFRDMQLMADCKHNIITTSSFGWWGAYFNNNPDKITCSPDLRYNTTHWF